VIKIHFIEKEIEELKKFVKLNKSYDLAKIEDIAKCSCTILSQIWNNLSKLSNIKCFECNGMGFVKKEYSCNCGKSKDCEICNGKGVFTNSVECEVCKGKRHISLRNKVLEYIQIFDYDDLMELLNRKKGFGFEVDLRNLITSKLDQYIQLCYMFYKKGEEEDSLGDLMDGFED